MTAAARLTAARLTAARACAAQLVRLVGGSTGGIDWRTRLQAADLLKFALARVCLSADAPADAQLLASMPSLVGELRAAARPLIKALVAHAIDEGPALSLIHI